MGRLAGQARRGWHGAAFCSSATDASWRGAHSSRGNVVEFFAPVLTSISQTVKRGLR